MRKVYVLMLMCCITLVAVAQKNAPKWLEKQRKAIVTISTFGRNNATLHTGTGYFITETGEVVSGYSLFKGAEKATVTDTDGNTYPVVSIIGADDMYDVIHVKAQVSKKVPYFQLATEPAINGAKVYMVPYSTEKKGTFKEGTITEVSTFKETYGYYKTNIPLEAKSLLNAPLLTENGQVLGLIQEDAAGDKTISYAVSVNYVNNIQMTSTDMLNSIYSAIGIRKAWPSDPEQAQVMLFLAGNGASATTYLETLEDFINTFPTLTDGYTSRASHYAYKRAELAAATGQSEESFLAKAEEDYSKAARISEKKNEVWFNQARTVYDIALSDTTLNNQNWTLARAMTLVQDAINLDDQPLYHQFEGDIYFALKAYESAYESYMKVNNSELASPTSYYYAAKTLELIPGSNIGDIVALLDKAIEATTVDDEKMVLLLERVEYKMKIMLYEEAIADYNEYFSLSKGKVGDSFYYYREQAKFRAGDFAGALADIQEARRLQPDDPNYMAEEASVNIRLEKYEDALVCLEKALALAPDFASCYRLKGICLVRQDKKALACDAFGKAKELGDPLANRLIREHCEGK